MGRCGHITNYHDNSREFCKGCPKADRLVSRKMDG